MSRGYNIHWRESDEQRLTRTVKNFNAKINRIIKKNPEAVDYLPAKITKAELREQIKTRADFNRVTNKYARFSRRDAEELVTTNKGFQLTQWEVQEFKIAQRTDNARKTRERKRLEAQAVTTRGEETELTRAEMGSVKNYNLEPSHKDPMNMNAKEFERAFGALERRIMGGADKERKEQYRWNYLVALKELNYPQDIIDHILQMDLNEFVDKSLNDEQGTIEFIYDPIEAQARIDYIREVWGIANNK